VTPIQEVQPLPDTSSASVVRPLITAAFPEFASKRPKLLHAGDEFDTWALGDAVVKFPKNAEFAAGLETEVGMHPLLTQRLGGIVPSIRAASKATGDFPLPFVAFERAAGRQGQTSDGPILQPKPWGRTALARELAGALSTLHTTPITKAKAAGAKARPISIEGGVEVEDGAIQWASRVAGEAVDTFLVDPIPAEARTPGKAVLCHGDLKGEHLFVSEDGTRVTAVIDWADVAIADPAVDLAGLAIWLGPSFVRDVLASYTGPADEGTFDRALFLARGGLLTELEAQLEGRSSAPVPVLEAQLRAVFGA
jgi:aminoglycoside phosphotransferase (APT) family kinase protein